MNILGIKASAYLNVTTTELEMYIYGKVLDLIYAELYVATAYDYLSITDMHFYIRAIVDLRGLTDVSQIHFKTSSTYFFKKACILVALT